MSEGNVEVVHEAIAALRRAFESYFRAPRSMVEATESGDWPEWNEVVRYIHPEVEWRTVFLETTAHGRKATASLWDDYLQWASYYRPDLDEVEDLGGDRVFAVMSLTGRDKATGNEMTARFYDVFTIRDGMIVGLVEYTSREEAMEAAGARE
jgi:ketosteroid isomerase-like protein